MIARRFELLRLSDEAVRRVVALAFPDDRVTGISLIEEGGINTNYRITTRNRDASLALRVLMRAVDTCARERALPRAVRGIVPAPEVYYAETEPSTLGHPFMIRSWLPGRKLAWAMPTPTPRPGSATTSAACWR